MEKIASTGISEIKTTKTNIYAYPIKCCKYAYYLSRGRATRAGLR